MTKSTALVFAGGGSRGAYEIGVWKALEELDISISMVAGTSVGALNGAIVAQGDFEMAEQLWKELETSRIFDLPLDESLPPEQKRWEVVRLFGRAAMQEGGVGTEGLKQLLCRYLDEEKIRRSPIDFGMVTVDLTDRKPCYLWKGQIPRGKLVDYLIASSTLFPAVRAQQIGGKKYIDGGYSDNMPVQMAVSHGASEIIAVDMNAIGRVRSEKAFSGCNIRKIRSHWELGLLLFFDPESARQNLRLGYLDTMRSYGIYDGFAFAFEKGMIQKVVRRHYGSFYEDLAGLGFAHTQKRFLDSVAYHAVEKQIFRRNIPAAQVRGFALAGMETAAEVFGLSNQKIYTIERFSQAIEQALAEISLPPQLEQGVLLEEQAIPAMGCTLELLQRAVRIKFLAKGIRGCLVRQQPIQLLPIAALMAEDFFAAYFLAVSNLIAEQ